MDSVVFRDWQCVRLATQYLEVLVTRSVGPRVVSFAFPGRPNVLGVVPDAVIGSSPSEYHLRGGHRLWCAPESSDTTYHPDDVPVEVIPMGAGASFTQPVEKRTGVQKRLTVVIDRDQPRLTVQHEIRNLSSEPIVLAPWAITMFGHGGVALLPIASVAESPVLPNQHLALWPYTRLFDSRLGIGHELLLVRGRPGSRLKVGFANTTGWLAYWQPGTVFVKRAEYLSGGPYPDFGSSSECFVGDHFLELETLGTLSCLQGGETVTHTEKWELHETFAPMPLGEEEALQLLSSVGLELKGMGANAFPRA